jgi:hypothetical protein
MLIWAVGGAVVGAVVGVVAVMMASVVDVDVGRSWLVSAIGCRACGRRAGAGSLSYLDEFSDDGQRHAHRLGQRGLVVCRQGCE